MKTTKKRLTLEDWNDLNRREQDFFIALMKKTGRDISYLPDIGDMIDFHILLCNSLHKDAQASEDYYYNNLILGEEFVLGYQGLGGEGEEWIDLLLYESRKPLRKLLDIHEYKTCARCYPSSALDKQTSAR